MSVMRMWSGIVRASDLDEYAAYILETGLAGYRATPGNVDAWMLSRALPDERVEITTVSLWESREAIAGFAGDDIDVARFYPEDDQFLLERDLAVRHYDVVG